MLELRSAVLEPLSRWDFINRKIAYIGYIGSSGAFKETVWARVETVNDNIVIEVEAVGDVSLLRAGHKYDPELQIIRRTSLE